MQWKVKKVVDGALLGIFVDYCDIARQYSRWSTYLKITNTHPLHSP